MDPSVVNATREHYNRHSNPMGNSREDIRRRQSGPTLPLKNFHNRIKSQLIRRFGYRADKLLDLCCGRGGDIRKWFDAQIRFVKGVDLSASELAEAYSRLHEFTRNRQGFITKCEFEATDALGQKKFLDEERPYDLITCFFSLHYFMAAEKSIQNLLFNVSMNLKKGGYFIGTCPDGNRVVQAICEASKRHELSEGSRGSLITRYMTLTARWEGSYKCFGSAYSFSIADTVTQGHGESLGSYEYLVFRSTLASVAATFGLKLVKDYQDSTVDRLFEENDRNEGFKHFLPSFPSDVDPSLEQASALNMAFVFQKVVDYEDGRGYYPKELEQYTAVPPEQAPPRESRDWQTRNSKRSAESPVQRESSPKRGRRVVRLAEGPSRAAPERPNASEVLGASAEEAASWKVGAMSTYSSDSNAICKGRALAVHENGMEPSTGKGTGASAAEGMAKMQSDATGSPKGNGLKRKWYGEDRQQEQLEKMPRCPDDKGDQGCVGAWDQAEGNGGHGLGGDGDVGGDKASKEGQEWEGDDVPPCALSHGNEEVVQDVHGMGKKRKVQVELKSGIDVVDGQGGENGVDEESHTVTKKKKTWNANGEDPPSLHDAEDLALYNGCVAGAQDASTQGTPRGPVDKAARTADHPHEGDAATRQHSQVDAQSTG
eukprot:evm.model.scf_2272.2 EVM.evm.TU.scf_2272.2   scf_2272:3469-9266(+)